MIPVAAQHQSKPHAFRNTALLITGSLIAAKLLLAEPIFAQAKNTSHGKDGDKSGQVVFMNEIKPAKFANGKMHYFETQKDGRQTDKSFAIPKDILLAMTKKSRVKDIADKDIICRDVWENHMFLVFAHGIVAVTLNDGVPEFSHAASDGTLSSARVSPFIGTFTWAIFTNSGSWVVESTGGKLVILPVTVDGNE